MGASRKEKEISDAYEPTNRKTRHHGQAGCAGDASEDGGPSADAGQARSQSGSLPTGGQAQIVYRVNRLAL